MSDHSFTPMTTLDAVHRKQLGQLALKLLAPARLRILAEGCLGISPDAFSEAVAADQLVLDICDYARAKGQLNAWLQTLLHDLAQFAECRGFFIGLPTEDGPDAAQAYSGDGGDIGTGTFIQIPGYPAALRRRDPDTGNSFGVALRNGSLLFPRPELASLIQRMLVPDNPLRILVIGGERKSGRTTCSHFAVDAAFDGSHDVLRWNAEAIQADTPEQFAERFAAEIGVNCQTPGADGASTENNFQVWPGDNRPERRICRALNAWISRQPAADKNVPTGPDHNHGPACVWLVVDQYDRFKLRPETQDFLCSLLQRPESPQFEALNRLKLVLVGDAGEMTGFDDAETAYYTARPESVGRESLKACLHSACARYRLSSDETAINAAAELVFTALESMPDAPRLELVGNFLSKFVAGLGAADTAATWMVGMSSPSLRINLAIEAALKQLFNATAAWEAAKHPAASGFIASSNRNDILELGLSIAEIRGIVLRHRFRPEEFAELADTPEMRKSFKSRLLRNCFVVTEGGQRLWSMRLERRRIALRLLNELGEMHLIVGLANDAGDTIAKWAASMIRHELPKLAEQGSGQLLKTLIAAQWLTGILPVTLPVVQIERRLALISLVEPLWRLIGRHDGRFGRPSLDGFVGRRDELSALVDYVGAPSDEHRASTLPVSSEANPPFLISGFAGSGKSALIAKLLVDHTSVDDAVRWPFVYLDFDRLGLAAAEPVNLLIEMSLQLSWQFAGLEAAMAALREKLRKPGVSRPTDGTQTVRDESIADEALIFGAEAIAAALHKTGLDQRPLLVVLDSFEEVQTRINGSVERVAALMGLLGTSCRSLRTIVAGRNDRFKGIDGTRAILQLGDLDREAAVAFALARGVDNATAVKIVNEVGGSPSGLRRACDAAAGPAVFVAHGTSHSQQIVASPDVGVAVSGNGD